MTPPQHFEKDRERLDHSKKEWIEYQAIDAARRPVRVRLAGQVQVKDPFTVIKGMFQVPLLISTDSRAVLGTECLIEGTPSHAISASKMSNHGQKIAIDYDC